MARAQLGEDFDVHGGGLDLIFPHHENERAQSEAAGERFARVWMHNGMLRLTGEKMSKSLGNIDGLRRGARARGPRDAARVLRAGATTAARWTTPTTTLAQASATAAGLREALRNARRYAAAGAARRDATHARRGGGGVRRASPRTWPTTSTRRARWPSSTAWRARINRAVAGGRCRSGGRRRRRRPARARARRARARVARRGRRRRSDEALALAVERAAARAAGDYARADELRDRDRGARLQRARHAAGAAGRAPSMADRSDEPPRDDLVYGLQPVREALRGRRRVREVVCTREAAEAMPWIESSGVRMSLAVADRVTALAERPDHQGVVALCDPYPYADAVRPARAPRRARGRARRRDRPAQPRRDRALLRVPRRPRARDPAARLRRRHRRRREGVRGRDRAPARSRRSRTWPSCCRRNKRAGPLELRRRRGRRTRRPDALDLTGGVVLVLGAEGVGHPPARAAALRRRRPHPHARRRSARSTSRSPRRCCSTRPIASAASRADA